MRAGHAPFAYGAALGFLGDLLAGDPRRGHPVAAFGRVAAAAERALWRGHRGLGALHTALCAGGAAAGAALLARTVRTAPAPRVAEAALTAAATWAVLGGTSLGREARAVGDALAAGDLAAARERLPHLCGRDPRELDEGQIARAVVESVAENTSDAVVGALVWGALGGVPGLVGFRAVNTLDAMVGHKSPRYRRFGWAAARLDDVVGWPGARLTAVLAAVAGPDPRGALRIARRDARKHPSPNAGPVEAAFAGALGVRLGGTLAYQGRVEHRPILGAELRQVAVADIERAVRLSRRVSLLALCCAIAGRAVVTATTGRGPGGGPARGENGPTRAATAGTSSVMGSAERAAGVLSRTRATGAAAEVAGVLGRTGVTDGRTGIASTAAGAAAGVLSRTGSASGVTSVTSRTGAGNRRSRAAGGRTGAASAAGGDGAGAARDTTGVSSRTGAAGRTSTARRTRIADRPTSAGRGGVLLRGVAGVVGVVAVVGVVGRLAEGCRGRA